MTRKNDCRSSPPTPWRWALCLGLLLTGAARVEAAQPTLPLAAELALGGDHFNAAVEYRRLALNATNTADAGGYFWAAAHESWRAGQIGPADKLAGRAEAAALMELEWPVLLLRSEIASAGGQTAEAAFYLESLLDRPAAPDDFHAFAALRLAGVRIREKELDAARAALKRSPRPTAEGQAAIERYARGRDKRPMVGGLLGLIPGCGYFYAGEYASGLRSLILNGLFIFGMVYTAEEEQWGAFGVITFFEITWYSGSIYGGIDASHRYNRRRLDECVSQVEGRTAFAPDHGKLPIVALRFEF